MLKVSDTGRWELQVGTIPSPKPGEKPKVPILNTLQAGQLPRFQQGEFSPNAWHRLGLKFDKTKIVALIDAHVVAEVQDAACKSGMAGLGCGWHGAQFDNFNIQKVEP